MEDIKVIYIYDRINSSIYEKPVVVEKGFAGTWATFTFSVKRIAGWVPKNCAFDLDGPAVTTLNISFEPNDVDYLVSPSKKALKYIQESDVAMRTRIRAKLSESIKNILPV
jgi:hypothetical protein